MHTNTSKNDTLSDIWLIKVYSLSDMPKNEKVSQPYTNFSLSVYTTESIRYGNTFDEIYC